MEVGDLVRFVDVCLPGTPENVDIGVIVETWFDIKGKRVSCCEVLWSDGQIIETSSRYLRVVK